MPLLKKKIFCRLCTEKKLVKAIDLGVSPLANQFLNYPRQSDLYPLKVVRCTKCNHLQLSHVVDKKKLFSKYLYLSGTSSTNLKHFKMYAKECFKRFVKKNNSKILDIASNDGSFLNFFKKKQIKVGIEPAKNILPKKKSANYYLENNFFNNNISNELKKKYGEFDLITANNVCAHVDDFFDFIKGVKNLLKNNGVFIFEVGYFKDVFKNKTFDTIYHEHLDYHLFIPLINFFNKFGMEIFDVKNIFIQGGSLRVYVSNINKQVKTRNIDKIVKNEKKINFSDKKVYIKYHAHINKIKYTLAKKIKFLKSKKYKIAGYGASAKSTTLLNYFNIKNKDLDFIADLNKLKHNRFTPGSNIKILPPKNINTENVDYLLILSWNFSKEIIKQNINFLERGGKFIIPFPKIIIVSIKNYKVLIKNL
jgi:SAM-dependent methyltransferase